MRLKRIEDSILQIEDIQSQVEGLISTVSDNEFKHRSISSSVLGQNQPRQFGCQTTQHSTS